MFFITWLNNYFFVCVSRLIIIGVLSFWYHSAVIFGMHAQTTLAPYTLLSMPSELFYGMCREEIEATDSFEIIKNIRLINKQAYSMVDSWQPRVFGEDTGIFTLSHKEVARQWGWRSYYNEGKKAVGYVTHCEDTPVSIEQCMQQLSNMSSKDIINYTWWKRHSGKEKNKKKPCGMFSLLGLAVIQKKYLLALALLKNGAVPNRACIDNIVIANSHSGRAWSTELAMIINVLNSTIYRETYYPWDIKNSQAVSGEQLVDHAITNGYFDHSFFQSSIKNNNLVLIKKNNENRYIVCNTHLHALLNELIKAGANCQLFDSEKDISLYIDDPLVLAENKKIIQNNAQTALWKKNVLLAKRLNTFFDFNYKYPPNYNYNGPPRLSYKDIFAQFYECAIHNFNDFHTLRHFNRRTCAHEFIYIYQSVLSKEPEDYNPYFKILNKLLEVPVMDLNIKDVYGNNVFDSIAAHWYNSLAPTHTHETRYSIKRQVELLLSASTKKINSNTKNNPLHNLLYKAIIKKDLSLAELLFKHGGNPNRVLITLLKGGWLPQKEYGSSCIELMLHYGLDANYVDPESGQPLLHLAELSHFNQNSWSPASCYKAKTKNGYTSHCRQPGVVSNCLIAAKEVLLDCVDAQGRNLLTKTESITLIQKILVHVSQDVRKKLIGHTDNNGISVLGNALSIDMKFYYYGQLSQSGGCYSIRCSKKSIIEQKKEKLDFLLRNGATVHTQEIDILFQLLEKQSYAHSKFPDRVYNISTLCAKWFNLACLSLLPLIKENEQLMAYAQEKYRTYAERHTFDSSISEAFAQYDNNNRANGHAESEAYAQNDNRANEDTNMSYSPPYSISSRLKLLYNSICARVKCIFMYGQVQENNSESVLAHQDDSLHSEQSAFSLMYAWLTSWF